MATETTTAVALSRDEESRAAEQVKRQAAELIASCMVHKITDEESARVADDLYAQLGKLKKEANEKRLERTRPLDELKRWITGLFQTAIEQIENAEQMLQPKILAWGKAKQAEIDRQRKEREAAELEANRVEQERARQAQELIDAGVPKSKIPDLIDAPATVTVARPVVPDGLARSASGNATTIVEEWGFEVVEPALVPRQYLTVDAVAIGRAVRRKDGVRSIPGVRIFKKEAVRRA